MIYKIFEIKNNYLLIILLLFWLTTNCVNAQDGNVKKEEQLKADEILLNARKAVGLGTEKLNIQNTSLIFNVSRNTKLLIKEPNETREGQENGEREFHSVLPNKFRYLETMNVEDTVSITKFILDDNLLDAGRYGMWAGQRTEIQIPGQENPTEEQKRQIIQQKKKESFFILFPVLLDSSGFFPLEFNYIGKAEFNSEKANVLEVTLSEESKIRLFFDETSHLLKMLITNSKTQNGSEVEEKRYYSDYKSIEGLKVAKKINIETKQLSKRHEFQSVEEQTLKTLKINSTFKSDFFEVKKK